MTQLDYRQFKLPKGNGTYRYIYVVSDEWHAAIKAILPTLNVLQEKFDYVDCSYGFRKNRNAALNAFQHLGYNYTISFDLKDFFDQVTRDNLKDINPNDILDLCLINDSPRQGMPSSPALCNIAFRNCDQAIKNNLDKISTSICYTRYADDLTISFNDKTLIAKIKHLIESITSLHGFKLNRKKTRLQSIANGRVIINGIALDKNGLHPTRKTKRKLRAALHQKKKRAANGLNEWAKCKFPKGYLA